MGPESQGPLLSDFKIDPHKRSLGSELQLCFKSGQAELPEFMVSPACLPSKGSEEAAETVSLPGISTLCREIAPNLWLFNNQDGSVWLPQTNRQCWGWAKSRGQKEV